MLLDNWPAKSPEEKTVKFLVTGFILCCQLAAASGGESPYSGQEQREIKSLSSSEIRNYLSGSGMGYAKAAELNHYPGPKHVLELADKLELSEEQAVKTREIHASMQQQAMGLGDRLVEKESLLDQQFASGSITESNLKALLEEIAILEGKIRYVHLAAHLEQKRVLNQAQVHRYDRLRGYGAGHHGHDH